MKTHFLTLNKLMFFALICLTSTALYAQTEIEYNSSSSNGPQLLLKETGSDFSRIWFTNNNDTYNYWALLGKALDGSTSADGILREPFLFSYSGTQILGLSSDGYLRINTQYSLPNTNGTLGQVLAIVDDSDPTNFITDWVDVNASSGSGNEIISDSGNTFVRANGGNGASEEIIYQVDGTPVASMSTSSFSVDQNVSLNQDLMITGSTDLNGPILNSATNAIQVASGNDFQLLGGNLNAAGNVAADGDLKASGDVEFAGFLKGNGTDVRVAAGENLNVTDGNLNVSGNIDVSDQISNSNGPSVEIASGDDLRLLGGDMYINGNLNTNGDMELSGFLIGNGTNIQLASGEDLIVNGGDLELNGNMNLSGLISSNGTNVKIA